MKKKIAFVSMRYGTEVNGGAELYCRQVAEHLTGLYDVTVYTTCAVDYVTWANEYRPGEEELNGVRVRRFAADRERDQKVFGPLYTHIITAPSHTDAEEERWIEEQGPVCPALIEAVAAEHADYLAVFFMTYLYYTTVRGMGLGLDNAILIPTVHDEPPVYLRCYDRVFSAARGIAWNTPEEQAFAYRRFPAVRNTPCAMTGIGVDGPTGALPEIPPEISGCEYLVYAGRIDESKGCREMFRYFLEYRKRNGGELKLVLMGKPVMDIPKDPDIVSLGFVSEEMKFAVMAKARALVLFSRFESLSMVVLESMLMGRPVLVTEKCEVLKGHCVRSNAGLYFDSYPIFEAALNYLLKHPAEYRAMCENGIRYVKDHYQWQVIVSKYSALAEQVGRAAGELPEAGREGAG